MIPRPPAGQGPIDPRGAFTPPPPPGGPQQTSLPPTSMSQASMSQASMLPGGGFTPPPGMYSQQPMGGQPGLPGGYPPAGFPPPGYQPGFTPQGFFPPPKPRGFGRALLTTFATTLFGISLMLNIYLLIISGLMGDHSSKSSTLVQGDPTQEVAVVPIINSIILQKDADSFDSLMKQVEKNSNVKALVLRIDTPGGEVAPSDEMYHRIRQYKLAHPNIPIVVSMGGMATSGGYYTACAADYLFAEPTTLTANIGVLMESLNFSGLIDKWGIKDTTLHSTGADYKTSGSMFQPQSEDDQKYLRGLLDSIADQFHLAVKTGRQGKLKASDTEIFNAQAYPAPVALKMGLIDQIGYQDEACKYAASLAKLTSMTVVTYEEPPSILKLLSARFGVAEPQANGNTRINGVSVDSPQLDRLLNPRPLYLFHPN